MKLKMLWIDRRYYVGKWWDAKIRWVAWHLPDRLVMWCFYRMTAHATGSKFPRTVAPGLSWEVIAKRWHSQ